MALTKITSSVVEDGGGIDHSNLPDTGVVSGSYGTTDSVPVLTVNEKGFVTEISTTPIGGYSFEVVATLPESPDINTIYFITG